MAMAILMRFGAVLMDMWVSLILVGSHYNPCIFCEKGKPVWVLLDSLFGNHALAEAGGQLGLLLLKLGDLGVDLSNTNIGGSVDENGGNSKGGGTERLGGGLEVHDFSFGWGLITSHVFLASKMKENAMVTPYHIPYGVANRVRLFVR